ncbi:thymidine kinase [Coralliovum pocilloporae]|uniref:thymidine kinase n=1 Tax=Coralliovum pocilloporae TaxID=3066369 RepID=UPI003307BCDB
MAKLYFNYSTMNAGKSTTLLQASYNYRERGMRTLLLTAAFDDRAGRGTISSRIGLEAEADTYDNDSDLFTHVSHAHEAAHIDAVFVDEAQFLTEKQVWQLAHVADKLRIPVLCYGIRTDFQGKLFPGSAALLALADALREIRTICWCGSKATMVVRLNDHGEVVEDGDQIEIGGNDRYMSLCRKHWHSRTLDRPKHS